MRSEGLPASRPSPLLPVPPSFPRACPTHPPRTHVTKLPQPKPILDDVAMREHAETLGVPERNGVRERRHGPRSSAKKPDLPSRIAGASELDRAGNVNPGRNGPAQDSSPQEPADEDEGVGAGAKKIQSEKQKRSASPERP